MTQAEKAKRMNIACPQRNDFMLEEVKKYVEDLDCLFDISETGFLVETGGF